MQLLAHVQFNYDSAAEVTITITIVELYQDMWTTDIIAQPYLTVPYPQNWCALFGIIKSAASDQ